MKANNFVLLTAARNEEKYIEKTICSVITQTILPQKWIIINDGSTDNTGRIVEEYIADHPFIELVKRNNIGSRSFSSKVLALIKGFKRLQYIDYAFICFLDADVSFNSRYF